MPRLTRILPRGASPGEGGRLLGGYYEELARHPSPHRWAGWRGPLDHALRFELALAGADFAPRPRPSAAGGGAPPNTPHSAPHSPPHNASHNALEVLDLGCGTGELAGYLAATGRRARYRGVDTSAAAVARGRRRHPEVAFDVADMAAPGLQADMVVAVGTMVDGRSLVAESARVRALARAVAAAWRHTRGRATVVVLDQDTLEAHPGWRTEPALGGARAQELERLGRHLAPRWEVRRSPVGTDLALTLWRTESLRGPRPTDAELVERALRSPWGQSADAAERAWLDRELSAQGRPV